jgi:hypothetical protein
MAYKIVSYVYRIILRIVARYRVLYLVGQEEEGETCCAAAGKTQR